MSIREEAMKVFCSACLTFSLGIMILSSSCSTESSPYKYGVVALKISDSQQVYFKREARGVSYDSLALSINGDPCIEPDPKSDFILHSSELPRIYYKIENGTLVLYLTVDAKSPGSGTFPVNVIQKKIHPIDSEEFKESYEKLGIKFIEIKLSEGLKCSKS